MITTLVNEAVAEGARQHRACAMMGLSARTLQRWQQDEGSDRRTTRLYEPPHKLSAEERARVLAVANSAEFGHLPPRQIVLCIPRHCDH